MAIPLLVEGGARDRAAGEPAAGVPAAGVPAAGVPAARARVDRILVIDVEESLQLQRVMARDGSTLEQARAILASQASRAERLAAADDVVLNSGTVPELRHEVDRLHGIYLRAAAARDSAKT
jgi:dephospho-CoA kinase